MLHTADEQQNGSPDSADEDVLPSVSLDDDEGSSGVGLAAAAAVSAAMARAWATAASREQRAVAAAAAAGGGGGQAGGKGVAGREPGTTSSGRAGFRLVATVTNKMGENLCRCLVTAAACFSQPFLPPDVLCHDHRK